MKMDRSLAGSKAPWVEGCWDSSRCQGAHIECNNESQCDQIGQNGHISPANDQELERYYKSGGALLEELEPGLEHNQSSHTDTHNWYT